MNSAFINEITIVISTMQWISRISKNSEKLNSTMNEIKILSSYAAMLQNICYNKTQLAQLETVVLVNILECMSFFYNTSSLFEKSMINQLIGA